MLLRTVIALRACAPYALSVLLAYALSAAVGVGMVHAGHRGALARRDAMVRQAVTHDQSSIDYRSGRGAAYYLGTLLLQFLAFSLCIGAGVRAGVALYRSNGAAGWRLWRYRSPHAVLSDVARVVASSVPLFLLASCYEFFSPWNA